MGSALATRLYGIRSGKSPTVRAARRISGNAESTGTTPSIRNPAATLFGLVADANSTETDANR
jgi:hypothetical protein